MINIEDNLRLKLEKIETRFEIVENWKFEITRGFRGAKNGKVGDGSQVLQPRKEIAITIFVSSLGLSFWRNFWLKKLFYIFFLQMPRWPTNSEI